MSSSGAVRALPPQPPRAHADTTTSCHVHLVDMALWLLFLAYIVSVVGSVVGLACTRRGAAASNERDRLRWLAMAAVSIGGVAVWLMHFIAMLGFAIPTSVVRYHL